MALFRLRVRKFETSNIDFCNLSEAEKHTYENPWGLTDLTPAEIDIRNLIFGSIGPYASSKTDARDAISRTFFAAVPYYTRLNRTTVCYVRMR